MGYYKTSGGSAWTSATGNDYSSNDDWTQAFYDYVDSLGGNKSLSGVAEAKYNFLSAMAANEYSTNERLAAQQWQEDYYNTYSSPSAMVSQYEDAGLNPALMYGNAGASTGSNASSSGASASQAASVSSNLSALDFVDTMTKSLSSIANNVESLSRSSLNIKNQSWIDRLNELALSEGSSRIEQTKANTDLSRANTELTKANTVLADFRSKTEDTQNSYLKQSIQNLMTSDKKMEKEIEGIGFDNMQKALDYTLDTLYKSSERNADLNLKDAQALLLGQQTRDSAANAWFQEWQNGFTSEMGFSPNSGNIKTMIGTALGSVSRMTSNAISDALPNVRSKVASAMEWFKNLFTGSSD